MANVVLDASALLAFLNREAGADSVAKQISDAAISVVNLSEVVAKLVEKGLSAEVVSTILSALPVIAVPADEALALRAGALRAQTKAFGLSPGDRFCLALAEREGAVALTADRTWSNVPLDIQIVLLR